LAQVNPQAAVKRTNSPGVRTDQTTTVEMLYAPAGDSGSSCRITEPRL